MNYKGIVEAENQKGSFSKGRHAEKMIVKNAILYFKEKTKVRNVWSKTRNKNNGIKENELREKNTQSRKKIEIITVNGQPK